MPPVRPNPTIHCTPNLRSSVAPSGCYGRPHFFLFRVVSRRTNQHRRSGSHVGAATGRHVTSGGIIIFDIMSTSGIAISGVAEIPGRRVRVLVRPSIMMSPSTRSIHLRTKFHEVGGYLITCLPAHTLQNKCYNINHMEGQQSQVTSNHSSHYDMKVFRADACANLLGAGSLPGGQWPKAHHGDI